MSAAAYVMGHNDRERRRLALQARILKPFTEDLLRRSGISRGMHVLELGCGVGDVTLLVAERVGAEGQVTALDIDGVALAAAEEKLGANGHDNVSFVKAPIDNYRPGWPVDAVVGRHILIHCPDPLAVLQNAYSLLPEGGIVAFQEFDFSRFPSSHPRSALGEQLAEVFTSFFCRAVHGDIGARLRHLLLKAGFEGVECRGEFGVCGGPDSHYYEWMAESLRTILPGANAMGLGLEFTDSIDTLAGRLRDEAILTGASMPGPVMVSAIARKPQ